MYFGFPERIGIESQLPFLESHFFVWNPMESDAFFSCNPIESGTFLESHPISRSLAVTAAGVSTGSAAANRFI